ncbi:MAG: RNA-binding S4 domain-containing protein [Candidatus Binatia bacterium]|nr:RNA-binding S4 domain-containing protein [Candidatus Binatia bacterium]
MGDHANNVRVDRWLLAVRVFKTRTLSQQACAGGKVSVNDSRVSAHRPVRIGDRVRIQGPRGLRDLIVLGLGERRLPAPDAQLLYEDKSPPPEPRAEAPLVQRERGSGRPSKRDRRSMERLRR